MSQSHVFAPRRHGVTRSLGVVVVALLAAGGLSGTTFASVDGPRPATASGQPAPIRFASTKSYRTGPSPQQVALADFDGNGTVDMVTANQGAATLSLLRGDGDGRFAKPVSIPAGLQRPLALATADLNGDGRADLVVVNGLRSDRVAVLLARSTGGFWRSTFRGGHRSQWVITADFNGDGTPDVATANARGDVSVLLGEGDGTLGPAVDYSTGSTMCSALTAADLDGDGFLDLVTTNSVLGNGASNHSVSVLMGHADGTFGPPVVYRHLGYQPTMPTTADLDEDGHLDVIAPMGGWPARYVTVLFGNGDGTLGRRMLLRAGPSAHDTVAVDLNGDGHVDLASSGLGTSYVIPTNQGISIRAGKGNGRFAPLQWIRDAWPSRTWRWPTWIGAADLNGDGRIDLVAPDERNDTVGVLLNRS
jgi:hypothetical protein